MEGLKMVAELMAVLTRAAPKNAGQDFPDIKVLEGDDVQSLAEEMLRFGEEKGKKP